MGGVVSRKMFYQSAAGHPGGTDDADRAGSTDRWVVVTPFHVLRLGPAPTVFGIVGPTGLYDDAMQCNNLPPDPQGTSPAGAHIRFLIEGPHGGMIHSTVPPGQINRAMQHKTVSEFWYVLEGHGQLWRRDGNEEQTVDLLPGVTVDIPVGAAFQYRNVGESDLRFICVTMPPWTGDDEAVPAEGTWTSTLDG